MNDISPKEAIANLNHIYGFVAPDIQRSLDVAIKALERPSGDCISRSVLDEIRQLYKDYQPNLATEVIEFGNALEELIDNAQAVDLWQMRQEATENALKKAEVLYDRPKGEWIIVKDEKYGNNVKCPFCGKELAGTDLNFCCKCGADMRPKGGKE